MKSIKVILATTVIGLVSFQGEAQTSNFTQYHLTPVYTSPAEAGMSDYFQVMSHYRKQSLGVDQGYENFSLAATYPLYYKGNGRRFGGISVGLMNETSGMLGLFRDQSLRAGYAYNWHVSQVHRVSIGLQAGYYRTSLATGKVTTDAQYQNGGYDPGHALGENFSDNANHAFKVDAGATWYGVDANGQRMFSLGFSAFNANRSSYRFIAGEEDQLPIRYQMYGSIRTYSRDRLDIVPTFRYLAETSNSQLNVGSLFLYQLDKGTGSIDASHLGLGVWYSLDNAAIVSLEWVHPSYLMSLSYDISTSSNVEHAQVNNGVELTLGWRMNKSLRK